MDEITWRKARGSDDKGGACVEVAALPGGVGVRDSKDLGGPLLLLDVGAFRTLLAELRQRS
ncbi:protein of unknown function [Actinomadura meyerae]|uniref:DUF397 domain-containing protein n=1 Tax=Actinomadura meyerae TaxID=240840 RepID=A0A239FRF4_9ACTN|nr:DUF397 domain-containing protein [Actinomadura meyerae]SNS59379.1 protein of unknown function [Actinomadura meyerae]